MFGKWRGSLRNSEGRICKKFSKKKCQILLVTLSLLGCWRIVSGVSRGAEQRLSLIAVSRGWGRNLSVWKIGGFIFFPGLENARCSARAWGHSCAALVGLFQRNSLITSYLHTYGILSWRQTHRFIFTYSPYRSTPHWFFCWSKKQ